MNRLYPLVLVILVATLSACVTAPAPAGSSPNPCIGADLESRAACAATMDAAAGAAQTAYQEEVSAATATANAATTATAAAVQATRDTLELRAQEAALAQGATSTAVALSIGATRSASSANATALAEANLASFDRQRLSAEATRLALANRREEAETRKAENWATFTEFLPWVVVAMIVATAGIGLYLYRQRSRPIVVVENGKEFALVPQNLFVRVTNGSRPNGAQPAGDEDPQIRSLGPPRRALPGRVELPAELPEEEIGVGVTVSNGGDAGRALWLPPADVDLLAAGQKGSGKSNMARLLAYQANVHGWHLHLADAEQVTFDPSIWGDVSRTPAEVEDLVDRLIGFFDERFERYREMFRRVRELPQEDQFYVESLPDYNRAAALFGEQLLRPALVVMDEANNLLGASSSLDEAIHELLRRNRKAGCGIALFGHTWHARQVPTPISTNLKTRVAFRCGEKTSRVVLGHPGAAEIPAEARGRVIVQGAGQGETQMQTFYLPAGRVLADVRPTGSAQTLATAEGDWRVATPEDTTAAVDGMSLDEVLGAGRLSSLHAVAKWLAGKDEANANADEYKRAARALVWRSREMDCAWSRDLLRSSSSQHVDEVLGIR